MALFDRFPNEICTKIFNYCNIKDTILICKQWNEFTKILHIEPALYAYLSNYQNRKIVGRILNKCKYVIRCEKIYSLAAQINEPTGVIGAALQAGIVITPTTIDIHFTRDNFIDKRLSYNWIRYESIDLMYTFSKDKEFIYFKGHRRYRDKELNKNSKNVHELEEYLSSYKYGVIYTRITLACKIIKIANKIWKAWCKH